MLLQIRRRRILREGEISSAEGLALAGAAGLGAGLGGAATAVADGVVERGVSPGFAIAEASCAGFCGCKA